MKVVIVARTRMQGGVCVGAVSMEDGRSLRLLGPTGGHLPFDAPYQIGYAWEVDFRPNADAEPPHVEDCRVFRGLRVDYVDDLATYLSERVTAWSGGRDALFGGLLLRSARGRGHISRAHGIPDCSTGFWRPDTPLKQVIERGRVYFTHGAEGAATIVPYVGMGKAPESIEAGSLARVSLSQWFAPREGQEAMCWLQMSGIY
jgi:hypothetical protein